MLFTFEKPCFAGHYFHYLNICVGVLPKFKLLFLQSAFGRMSYIYCVFVLVLLI